MEGVVVAGNRIKCRCLAITGLLCLCLETGKDALDHGIFQAVAAPPHARHQTMRGQLPTEAMVVVLAPLIAMQQRASEGWTGAIGSAISARQTGVLFITASRQYPSTRRVRRCIAPAGSIHPRSGGENVI